MAYPALDPCELPGMPVTTVAALLQGRIALVDQLRDAGGSEATPARPAPDGICWDDAASRGDGTQVVPVRGLEGLKQFLRMTSR